MGELQSGESYLLVAWVGDGVDERAYDESRDSLVRETACSGGLAEPSGPGQAGEVQSEVVEQF